MFVSSILAGKGGQVVAVSPADSISSAVDQLAARRIGAVLAVDDMGRPVGVLSERDVVRVLARDGVAALQARVADVMSAPIVTCDPDDTLDHVMGLMTDRRIRHLPVVRRGELLGIVSIGDVVKFTIDETRHEAEALKQYIATG